MKYLCYLDTSQTKQCAIDRDFEPPSGQTSYNKIVCCCFSAKPAAFNRKSKEWFTEWDNVSEWSDVS